MKRALHTLFLLLMLVVAHRASAEVRDIQMHYLGIEKGLSHQSITSFCQDEFGFIWIATQDGLNRYDGRVVDVFKPDGRPHSISSNNIRQLYCDGQGSIYLRSFTCIERYDQRLGRFETLYEGDVESMACDSLHLYLVDKGQIWRIQHRHEECRKKPSLIYSFSQSGLNPGTITHLVITDTGLAMRSSKWGLIELVDDKIIRHQQIGDLNAMLWDPAEGLWVLTRDSGIYCFDRSWQLTRHYTTRNGGGNVLAHNNVRSIVPIGDHLYYVGSFGGLQLLDTRTDTFTDYDYEQANNIKMRSILSMFYDRQRTLWMGTFHTGVQYHHSIDEGSRFYRIASTSLGESSSPIVCAVAEDDNGLIWLGTEGDGLICFDPARGSFNRFAPIASNEVIKALYFDRERRQMWATTLFHGVVRIDLKNNSIRWISPVVTDVLTGRSVGEANNSTRILEDGKGDLLICSRIGLVRLDREQMRLEAIDNEALFRRSVSQIWDAVLDGDDLWMATSFDLMRLSRSTGKVSYYSFADISGRQASQYISHLVLDHSGRLYLGSSGGGVFRYDVESDRFEQLGNRQGLANGFITALAAASPSENGAGEVYVAHSHGFSRIDASGEVENHSLLNSSPLMTINENGLCALSSRHLVVCGPQGMLLLQPEQMKPRALDYDIYIKEILVDNRKVEPLDSLQLLGAVPLYERSLELPSRHSSVSFVVAHNNYRHLPATELEYCLEGFDSSFKKLDNGGEVTYTNLKGGNYRFVVRGVAMAEGVNTPEASFSLKVRTPLYGRLWFQLLVLLILGGIGATVFRLWLRRQKLEQMLRIEQVEKNHIEQANAQKLRFFTNLSHEFRTPLTLIMGQVEVIIARQDVKPSVYNKVLNIYRNTQRLKHLVDEIIDIRRLDQSGLRLQVGRHDLKSAVQEVFLSFQDFALHHRIDFKLEAPEGAFEADFDRRQMERVLNNLLSNAFKYTKAGGSIYISLTAVGDDELCLAVSDTGVGIASEHLNHIFERFWQEERANASIEQYGSGIGLSLAKNLVEMHNGTIEVESTPGRGSTFSLRMPRTMRRDNPHTTFVEVEGEPLVEIPPMAELPAPPESEQPLKVVLVEDNDEMREMLRQIFEPFYQVSLACNGEEGLELVRKTQPDLVVSDVMMPCLSGIELCKRLKTEFETSHIPVVLLTAYNSEEHTIEGLLTGADDYVAKPFNVRILLARCNNIIMQRRRLQSKLAQSADQSVQMLSHHPLDQKLLTDAMAIVEAHLSDSEFSVVTFAQELGLSRTLLFSKLKGITGQTPNEFILGIRLSRAVKRIGEEPSVTIAEIAYDLGFSTPSYFIRCFRARYGVTPNAWRKQALAEEV